MYFNPWPIKKKDAPVTKECSVRRLSVTAVKYRVLLIRTLWSIVRMLVSFNIISRIPFLYLKKNKQNSLQTPLCDLSSQKSERFMSK